MPVEVSEKCPKGVIIVAKLVLVVKKNKNAKGEMAT